MKKTIFLITILSLVSTFTLASANSNTSLKDYLDKNDIENTITQKETAPSHPVAVEDVDQAGDLDAKKDVPQGQNKYRDPPLLS